MASKRRVSLNGPVVRELLGQRNRTARWLAQALSDATDTKVTESRVSRWLAPVNSPEHRGCPEQMAYEICRLLAVRHFDAVLIRGLERAA